MLATSDVDVIVTNKHCVLNSKDQIKATMNITWTLYSETNYLIKLKDLFPDFSIIFISSISRYPHKNLKSKISAFSKFALVSCEQCVLLMLHSHLMLKILSYPIINHTIGICPNKLTLATLFQDFLVFHQFATTSIQNNPTQISGRPSIQNIWE